MNPLYLKSRNYSEAFTCLAVLLSLLAALAGAPHAAAAPAAGIDFTDPAVREEFERSFSPGNYRGPGNIVGLEEPFSPNTAAAAALPGAEQSGEFPTGLPPLLIPALAYMETNPPWPLGSVPLSSGFDYPVGGALDHGGFDMINCFGCDVVWLGDYGHTAEDYANGRYGDAVYAASEGIVLWRGTGPNAYGNVVIIQHKVEGAFIYTLYAHLQSINVVPGQVVGRRQQIATLGSSGSFLPHLHFEMRTRPHIAPRGYTFYSFSGASVDAYDMTFYSPSWYISTHRHLDDPFGGIDGADIVPGGFKVFGWALDPDTPAPIGVHAYMGGRGAALTTADRHRWDVGTNFPSLGPLHGFSAGIPAGPGTHDACLYAINAGPGANRFLGCYRYHLSTSPVGSLDGVGIDGDGRLLASGWVIDPDTAAPADVHFYVNGEFAGAATATDNRSDVAARFPEYGGGHGFTTALPKLPGMNDVCAYGINLGSGGNALLGCRTVFAGLELFPPAPVPAGRSYYWTWFDGHGADDWLLLANPAGAAAPLAFDVNLEGRSLDLALGGNPPVAPGTTLAAGWRGIAGGPVVATETGGDPAVVSQRILWGGRSLEEVPGIEAGRLTDHYYWPWYDQQTPGFADWVMLANPGTGSVYYEITIAGADPGPGASGTIDPGGRAHAAFPGVKDGPVEVRAWTGADKAAPADLVASQRILSGDGTAFTEVPGIPAGELSGSYLWPWYDAVGTAGRDWIMLANPPGSPAGLYYSVRVGGATTTACAGPVAPGGYAFWKEDGTVAGPVELTTFADSDCTQAADAIATQRSLWGPSFEEVPGTPAAALASSWHWTWYDGATDGARNWVMLTNPGADEAYYEITIAGADPGPGASGTIAPGASAYASFPGRIGGPVAVDAWQTLADGSPDRGRPADILAAQRIIWNGFFVEVQGSVP